MYKFFVTEAQIEKNKIQIQEDDVNHIVNVLRLPKGEHIQVTDITNARHYETEIIEENKDMVICRILNPIEKVSELHTYIHLLQGLPKAEKMEWIIQKTTELGISEITPIVMKRCVVKLDAKNADKKQERWQKIAEVAAKQSKREKIPKINSVIFFSKMYEKVKDYDIVLLAYEKEIKQDIKSILKQMPQKPNLRIAIIIGPEGGIEENEIDQLRKNGAICIGLGSRILRTETAPIVLTSIIMYERDEMK